MRITPPHLLDGDVFERAAALVEAGWTQGQCAINAKGKKVRWERDEAVAFCMVGAVSRALWPNWTPDRYSAAFSVLAKLTKPLQPFGWNDHRERTQAEVVDLLRRAGR